MTAGCFYQNYREVRLLIIHCSATRYDRDFPVEALRASHKARGFADIGYHFYITRDGYLHRCRPVNQIGAHAAGWNDRASASVIHTSMRRETLPTPVLTPRNVRCSTLLRQLRVTIRGEDSGTLPTESLHPQGLPLLRRQGEEYGLKRKCQENRQWWSNY